MTQTPDDSHLPAVRIGDAERNAAVDALGEHLSAGRLTMTEFSDRSAAASAATTSGELVQLFHDLPAPRPLGYPSGRPVQSAAGIPERRTHPNKKIFYALAGAMPIICTLIFAISGWDWWWVYLLIPLTYTIGGVWANSSDDDEGDSGRRAVRD